jgi:hypothetical protein
MVETRRSNEKKHRNRTPLFYEEKREKLKQSQLPALKSRAAIKREVSPPTTQGGA